MSRRHGHDDSAPAVRCRISVRAVPGSARSAVVGPYGYAWKVRLAAAPEKGRANDELVQLLAQLLGVDRRAVRVIAGAGARDKIVEIDGRSAEATAAMLLEAAGG